MDGDDFVTVDSECRYCSGLHLSIRCPVKHLHVEATDQGFFTADGDFRPERMDLPERYSAFIPYETPTRTVATSTRDAMRERMAFIPLDVYTKHIDLVKQFDDALQGGDTSISITEVEGMPVGEGQYFCYLYIRLGHKIGAKTAVALNTKKLLRSHDLDPVLRAKLEQK